MNGKLSTSLLSLCIVMLLISICTATPARRTRPRKAANRTVSPNYIYKRLRILERKHQVTENELSEAKDRITELDQRYSRMAERLKQLSDDPPCPQDFGPGFHYAEAFNSCYKLLHSLILLNWTEADAACQNVHSKAYSVAMETVDEVYYLRSRLLNERGIGSHVRYWTSGRFSTENGWRWTSTGDSLTFDAWVPGAPFNDADYGCLAMHSSENFLWGDIACWAPSMVLCEVNL